LHCFLFVSLHFNMVNSFNLKNEKDYSYVVMDEFCSVDCNIS